MKLRIFASIDNEPPQWVWVRRICMPEAGHKVLAKSVAAWVAPYHWVWFTVVSKCEKDGQLIYELRRAY